MDEEDPDNDKVDMTGEDADTLDSTGMEGATPTGGGVRGVVETLVCMVGDTGSVCLLMAIRRGRTWSRDRTESSWWVSGRSHRSLG